MYYLFFTSKNGVQKQFVHTFEEIMFELKYDVANDTKEEELGIESVRTY